MNATMYNRSIPVRRRLLPAWPPLRTLTSVSWRGFVHQLNNRYNEASPRTGKLRAMFQAFGIRLWCSHRSNDKADSSLTGPAAVSCVGRLRRMNRDVALSPRRLSAGFAGDRKQLTNAYATSSTHDKTRQRRPATWWATRRKAFAARMRATGTKEPRFGLTDRARWGSSTSNQHRNYQSPLGSRGKWPDMVVVRIASASAPLNGCFQSHFCESPRRTLRRTPRCLGKASADRTAATSPHPRRVAVTSGRRGTHKGREAMAMNKKEQAAFADLQEQLRLAKAMRFTEAVEPDVPIPGWDTKVRLAKGWLYNAYIGGCGYTPNVDVACSSSTGHSYGNDDKTTTQNPRRLYSTRLMALRALRHDVELQVAKILADIDSEIEKEQGANP